MLDQLKRSGAAVTQAHRVGGLIEEAKEAQDKYEEEGVHRQESDKVSLELDRLLEKLKKTSPRQLERDARELLKTLRHIHKAINRYYELNDDERTEVADELALRADRLTVTLAGLNADEYSVRDFSLT